MSSRKGLIAVLKRISRERCSVPLIIAGEMDRVAILYPVPTLAGSRLRFLRGDVGRLEFPHRAAKRQFASLFTCAPEAEFWHVLSAPITVFLGSRIVEVDAYFHYTYVSDPAVFRDVRNEGAGPVLTLSSIAACEQHIANMSVRSNRLVFDTVLRDALKDARMRFGTGQRAA